MPPLSPPLLCSVPGLYSRHCYFHVYLLDLVRLVAIHCLCYLNPISIPQSQGKISEKWIEECLPAEYKRKYIKSELSSLSQQRPKRQLIEVSTGGDLLSKLNYLLIELY
jgi:hypothetical protein